MSFLKSSFSHRAPVVATNMSIDCWCHQLGAQPTPPISKVEMCTAAVVASASAGRVHTPIHKNHLHTLLRVFLVPTFGDLGVSEDVLFIERVYSTGGVYHSVIPITEAFSDNNTVLYPGVHDRIFISDGPLSTITHNLKVERTLTFNDGLSEPSLDLAQFAQILEFVSQTTMLVCASGQCKYQSRSFAFTCLAALTPSLPPTLVREGERVGMSGKNGDVVDDSTFELAAESFFERIAWLVNDPLSMQALRLIRLFRD